jgi:hypothetical protein
VKLHHEWHLRVAIGYGDDICDIERLTVLGTASDLVRLAERKIRAGVWDRVWLFGPGSDSSLDAEHPGNPYVAGDVSMEPDHIAWTHLDE